MSTNKYISYLLCNKGIIVNLYKLHFPSSHFSFQPNKRVFHPPTFSSLQPNTHEEKLNIFHPFSILLLFYLPTFLLLQQNGPLVFISIFKTTVQFQIWAVWHLLAQLRKLDPNRTNCFSTDWNSRLLKMWFPHIKWLGFCANKSKIFKQTLIYENRF